MPVTKTPSNIPAPPIEAISAPRPSNLSRLARSADESAEAAADIGRRRGLSVRMQKDGKERHRLSPILAFFGIDRDWHLERLGGFAASGKGSGCASNPFRCITSCPWCTNRAAGIHGTWVPQGTGLHPPRRACSPVPVPGPLSSSRSSWLCLQFKG